MILSGVTVKRVRVVASALVLGLAGASLAAIETAEAARQQAKRGGGYSPPVAEIVVDAQSGKVMHSLNPDAPRYPASITKVMTLFMLFDEIQRGKLRLDSELTASAYAVGQPPSKLGLRPGEKISVEDAIKALVTRSANDVAVVVAENISGSEAAFAQQMTAKARRLGMNRTTFVNPHGLPNTRQVSTARDLATLGQAIQEQHPQLYRYFNTRSFSWKGSTIRTHNRLLGRVEAVDGIKTGFIRASGFNLLTSAKESNRHVVAVVLGGRTGAERDSRMQNLVLAHLPKATRGSRRAPLMAETSLSTQGAVAQVVALPVPPPANIRSAVVTAAMLPATTPAPVAEPAVAQAPMPKAMPATLRDVIETAESAEPVVLPVAAPANVVAQAQVSEETAAVTTVDDTTTGVVPVSASATTPTAAQRVAWANDTVTPDSQSASNGMRWVTGPKPQVVEVKNTETLAYAATTPVEAGNTATTGTVTSGAFRGLPVKSQTALRVPSAPAETVQVAAAAPATDKNSIVVKTVAVNPIDLNAKATHNNQRTESVAPAAPKVAAAVEPSKPAVAETQAPVRTGWFIQIGATDNVGSAEQLLERARTRAAQVLSGAEPFTEPVAKGDTTLYRARFAGFNEKTAQAACKALQRNSIACFAIRN